MPESNFGKSRSSQIQSHYKLSEDSAASPNILGLFHVHIHTVLTLDIHLLILVHTFSHFLLKLPATPDVPINLHVDNFTWNAVLLSWISGFDGGFQQQIVIEARSIALPRAIDWSRFMKDSTDVKTFTVNDVPRVQTSHQCWLEGLLPATTYRLVMYGKNRIGTSPKSEEITVETSDIHFPSLKNAELLSRELHLSFERSTPPSDFCVQAERSSASLTMPGWVIFYNDCPTVSRTIPSYTSTFQVTRCLVSGMNRRLRAPTNHPFIINENNELPNRLPQNVNSEVFGGPTKSKIQNISGLELTTYNLSISEDIQSEQVVGDTIYIGGKTKTWSEMWLVLICVLLPAASFLGLLFAFLRWKKQRLITNQVWIPRTRKKKQSTRHLEVESSHGVNTHHSVVSIASSELPLSRIPSSTSFHSPVYTKSPSKQELLNCTMSSYYVSSSDKEIFQTQFLQETANPAAHPPISFCPILVDSPLSIAMSGSQLDTLIQGDNLPCSSSSQTQSVLLIPASQFSTLQLATSKTPENGTSVPFIVHLPVSPISSSTGNGNNTGYL
ncbi:hypothetical protein PHET_01765 [Paragonimus heterotremus]|uniref:Fibronectin type-III domain-containing protein n=1 Tax=Paragonimus heterotremus TaxID=100268 RepID=A0A8J4ST72_9TREM|nr:hypothetical protein PHET_01765 [Paragonimus heterotremus]